MYPEQTVPPEFRDKYAFPDEVLGPVTLSEAEKDLVDTPEFQRLFRTSQLGFVDLVYHCANHTRAIHSIGSCHWAKRLLEKLKSNQSTAMYPSLAISPAESILISMGALLHDISHGPFAHDIEKKTHEITSSDGARKLKIASASGAYEKHDTYALNPTLFVTLLEKRRSVVARVLAHYSPSFWRLLVQDSQRHQHLLPFVQAVQSSGWDDCEQSILPALVFHLLFYETPLEARDPKRPIRRSFDSDSAVPWGIGPNERYWGVLHETWYQPYRHDIIGDTLSADLLDYLLRDLRRLGINKALDHRLLDSYVMLPVAPDGRLVSADELSADAGIFQGDNRPRYRCAIDLNNSSDNIVRMDRLNDVFRLLDLRHEIHEKAVFHPVVQSAIAMLSRALVQLGESKPKLESILGFQQGSSPALCGEDTFLNLLTAAACAGPENTNTALLTSQSIAHKLAERRIYRPLLVIPGDRIRSLLQNLGKIPADGEMEPVLREIAALVDSKYFRPLFGFVSLCMDECLQHSRTPQGVEELISEVRRDKQRLERLLTKAPPKHVIFSAMPYKQLYKSPQVLLFVGDRVIALHEVTTRLDVNEFLRARVAAGLNDMESKYAVLWKLYVFLSDGLFYTGPLVPFSHHRCSGNLEEHAKHLEWAQILAIRALRAAWEHWIYLPDKAILNEGCHEDSLAAMLEKLEETKRIEILESIRTKVAAINPRRYVHSQDANGLPIERCGDIRYRFDLRGESVFREVLERFKVPQEDAAYIEQLFVLCGRSPGSFGREELLEIVSRLSKSPRRLRALASATAARGGSPVDQGILDSIWNDPDGDALWNR